MPDYCQNVCIQDNFSVGRSGVS